MRILVTITLAALSALSVSAKEMSAVGPFALLDQNGVFQDFAYDCRTPGLRGLVLFSQGNGCPLVRKRVAELKRLRDVYAEKGIAFKMINANAQDERVDILRECEEFAIDFPVLIDSAQVVAPMLGIDRTAEALLIDVKTKKIVYRGAIDDKMSYQTEKPEAESHYLKNALDAFLADGEINVPQTEAPGCQISFPETEISYAEHVAPILKAHCVECHTSGGLGPFPMSNYKKVSGWSEMIEEVLISKQMPPWHADPAIGHFANDISLTDEETRTLITWVRAGSPRGEGEDPLEGYVPDQKEWALGSPDHIINIPSQDIPAEGVLDYRYETMESPFDSDTWITAADVKPGNTRVLHHVIVTAHPRGKGNEGREKWIAGYAPGTGPSKCAPGSAVLLPKGWDLRFQLHYTVSGKLETDATQLGLYITKEAPEKEFQTGVVIHSKFKKIPANDPEHQESYTKRIKKDAIIYAMNPHMHFRGKHMRFDVEYPDGRKEALLSVPNYNFNWQRTYHLAEPLRVPAGSKLTISNAWDNSTANPYNPDPNRVVGWGEQSFDEMFFATYTFTEVGE